MTENQTQDRALSRLEMVSGALQSGVDRNTRLLLATLSAAEASRLLESLPRDKRYFVWRLAGGADEQGEILSHVNEEARAHLIDAMQDDELLAAVLSMDMDDLADVFADLPEAVTKELLASMDAQDRQRL